MKKKDQKAPIERVTPDPAVGLNAEQIAERKQKGYSNVSVKSLEKSTARIIFDNTFTFFNSILFLIAMLFLGFIIYLYAIGRPDVVDRHFGFSKFGFMIPAIMNVIVGTFQELSSRRGCLGLPLSVFHLAISQTEDIQRKVAYGFDDIRCGGDGSCQKVFI